MPLHEYACEACDSDFEVLVSAKDAEPVRCPTCEGAKVRRLFGLPAKVTAGAPATNCRGDGPPCGAARCGRKG